MKLQNKICIDVFTTGQEDKWIDITCDKSKLPTEGIEVLICHQLGYINIAKRQGNNFALKNTTPVFKTEGGGYEHLWDGSYPVGVITHWMLMPKLPGEIDKATLILKRPKNEEINEFQAKRFSANTAHERLEHLEEYFDVLLIGVENLEDDSGVITVDRKDAIPANWKQDIIAKLELETKIDIKN